MYSGLQKSMGVNISSSSCQEGRLSKT